MSDPKVIAAGLTDDDKHFIMTGLYGRSDLDHLNDLGLVNPILKYSGKVIECYLNSLGFKVKAVMEKEKESEI